MKKQRMILSVGRFAVVVLVLFVVIIGAVKLCEDRFWPENTDHTQISEPDETVDTLPDIDPEPELEGQMQSNSSALIKDTFHLLLVGQDRREGEGRGRSDTMILCSFDPEKNTLTMTSFLRDIYLEIPGHSSNRLNAAYAWGGFQLLNETLEEHFGVCVDANLEIDFNGFIAMIDFLGGVDVELTEDEASYLNNHYNWENPVTEGLNHLDGSQTLAYSRIRYLDSDFVRTVRQRTILTAILNEFRTATLQEVRQAMNELLEQSTTDMTDEQILGYALGLYPMLMDCEIITQRIPADETYEYKTIRGMSVIEIDVEANREILGKLLNESVA